jgi:hypothetical protein
MGLDGDGVESLFVEVIGTETFLYPKSLDF